MDPIDLFTQKYSSKVKKIHNHLLGTKRIIQLSDEKAMLEFTQDAQKAKLIEGHGKDLATNEHFRIQEHQSRLLELSNDLYVRFT